MNRSNPVDGAGEFAVGIKEEKISPYARLKSPKIGEIRWTGGFWGEKSEKCFSVMIPNMWRLLNDPQISHAYANFLIAAGIEEGNHRGPPWHDGDFYKWFEAAVYAYAYTRNEDLRRQLDKIVGVFSRVQRKDGYIHTPVIIKSRRGEKVDDFPDPDHFVTYNMGHLMTAASAHFLVTGDRSFLEIAERACEYLYDICCKDPVKLARNAVCPSHYMGVIDLYRVTGKTKYLELAKRLIEIRDIVGDGTDQNQDRKPLRMHERIVGHAVRANYLYAGVADIYAEIGDESLLSMLEKVWQNLVNTKMYITGACGALYDGASPYGGEVHREIQLVHQAYGLEYQLPNAIAHNESCAAVGNILWNWRMLKILGQARFAEILELTLYNAILAAISLDGTKFFYTNTLRQVELPYRLRWSRVREPYIKCFCCPPNIVRIIAQSAMYAYLLSHDGVWVNLYGSNMLMTKLNGDEIVIRQETEYPWEGYVKLCIDKPSGKKFTLYLRIPEWSDRTIIKVNGQEICDEVRPGTYMPFTQVWQKGDEVEVYMSMRPKLIEAHPLVEECRNQVAVKRGPIVYCLESIDLPDYVGINEVFIPRDISFLEKEDAVAGERLISLEGRFHVYREGDWKNKLYRERVIKEPEEINAKLIPYYAWGNRGPSEMCVWIPLD
ncbi:MAG: glycoside hydrolase family 127 protein [Nitrososphaerota archaeon]|nr:glycoside hydrolase family 127 protein [Candidatus Bathyarchaeota archaeon]MDW8048688.1 glycoside hydrolase family 127 protein [Nitrososphaerota archaeon]